VTIFSFAIAALLAYILKSVKVLRVSEDAEVGGIDIADHGETAYDFTPSGGSGGGGAFAMAGLTQSHTDGTPSVSEKVAG
jgi:Amt family ammonium transporter